MSLQNVDWRKAGIRILVYSRVELRPGPQVCLEVLLDGGDEVGGHRGAGLHVEPNMLLRLKVSLVLAHPFLYH